MLTTTASYLMITKDLTRSLSITAAKPQVSRESEYYLANIGNVKSIDDFLGDDRIFALAMKAFGLGEMTFAKAFMRKVLTEGIDDRQSFANSLADPRYREFAQTFNFARFGATTTVFDRTRQGTVDRYLRQTLEEDAGQQNEGVRLALYFERKAANIGGALDVLADRALLTVVRTALGLPVTISLMDLDRQAQVIASRVNFEDFKEPHKLRAFLNRFTSLWELENPTRPSASPMVLIGQPIEAGIAPALLASLQNLKLGGR